jgi:hypothetical protein
MERFRWVRVYGAFCTRPGSDARDRRAQVALGPCGTNCTCIGVMKDKKPYGYATRIAISIDVLLHRAAAAPGSVSHLKVAFLRFSNSPIMGGGCRGLYLQPLLDCLPDCDDTADNISGACLHVRLRT